MRISEYEAGLARVVTAHPANSSVSSLITTQTHTPQSENKGGHNFSWYPESSLPNHGNNLSFADIASKPNTLSIHSAQIERYTCY